MYIHRNESIGIIYEHIDVYTYTNCGIIPPEHSVPMRHALSPKTYGHAEFCSKNYFFSKSLFFIFFFCYLAAENVASKKSEYYFYRRIN